MALSPLVTLVPERYFIQSVHLMQQRYFPRPFALEPASSCQLRRNNHDDEENSSNDNGNVSVIHDKDDNVPALPMPHLWPVPEYEIPVSLHGTKQDNTVRLNCHVVACKNCKLLFCSSTCHRTHCFQMGSCCTWSTVMQSISDVLEREKSVISESVQEALVLATRLFCRVVAETRCNGAAHATTLLEGLCGEPADILPLELGVIQKENGSYTCLPFYTRLRHALALTQKEQDHLSLEYFHRLVAVAARNGIALYTQSPFQIYYNALLRSCGRGTTQHTSTVTILAKMLGSSNGTLERSMDRQVRDKVAVLIAGLFLLTSRINHSCDPNAQVQGQLFVDCNIDVVATRDIAKGEEITISYLHNSRRKSRHQRIRALQSRYFFLCQCPKCMNDGVA